MKATLNRETMMTDAAGQTSLSIQVLYVQETSFVEDQDSPAEGIYTCHAPLVKALRQIWTTNRHIDAVIIGPEYSESDIVSIREVTNQKVVPLILHTPKYDLVAKDIAVECEVDEYHAGPFDRSFMKRIELIKRVKSFKNAFRSTRRLRQQADGSPSASVWLLKRTFDIVVSITIIVALFPFLLAILLVLKLEMKGAVICSSRRVGKNYKIFDLYKFESFPSVDE